MSEISTIKYVFQKQYSRFINICCLRKANLKFLYISNIKGTEAKGNQK